MEHLPARVGDVRDSQADNERLRCPGVEPYPFENGLQATVEWADRMTCGGMAVS